MTVPKSQDTIYGIKYDCKRYCSDCGAYNWYDLKATEHLLCLDCGKQEPMD